VVVMLNLGNETEKPVIDARLRMSLADTIHVGTLCRRELAVPVAQRTEVAALQALPAKQAVAAVTSIRKRNKHLDQTCDKKVSQHQDHKLV